MFDLPSELFDYDMNCNQTELSAIQTIFITSELSQRILDVSLIQGYGSELALLNLGMNFF